MVSDANTANYYVEPESIESFRVGVIHRFFNSELRQRRQALGLTQKQLADKVGVTSRTITELETFKSYPKPEIADAIARFLGVSPSRLFPAWLKECIGLPTTVVSEHEITEADLPASAIRYLPSPEDIIDTALKRRVVLDTVATLNPRAARIIRDRFGFDGGGPRTLTEVAELHGTTRERVRQIEAKALVQLRHPTRSKHLRGLLNSD